MYYHNVQYVQFFSLLVLTLSRICLRWVFRSSSAQCRNRCGWRSAAQKVRRSTAVKRVCLREGTKTMTGDLGEYLQMAWYTGFIMAISLDGVCVMLNPCSIHGNSSPDYNSSQLYVSHMHTTFLLTSNIMGMYIHNTGVPTSAYGCVIQRVSTVDKIHMYKCVLL